MSPKSAKLLPALLVPAVVVAGALALPVQASADVDLPDKTPAELLTMVSESKSTDFSGTVEKTADLGLPAFDLGDGPDDMGILELITGTHTARVFVDAPDNLRVQVQDQFDERNLIVNANDAWLYDSNTNTATHLSDDVRERVEEMTGEWEADARSEFSTPGEAADHLLDELDETTGVAVGEDARVAGRTAYELVLTPKSSATLVESVSIAVDSETGVPLQLVVRAIEQEAPAFTLGFTSIDFSTPSTGLFEFTPPPGATVEEVQPPEGNKPEHGSDDMGGAAVIGTGWESVIELAAPSASPEDGEDRMLEQLTVQVKGGRLLSTSLMNVLFTDDGRILAGAVSLERLQSAAGAN